jgi:FtsP/CotA-like multicopper oxidase with cupredoxin domain
VAALASSLLLAATGTACIVDDVVPVEDAPADDSFPVVQGLTAIEDEDPSTTAVRYTLSARAADIALGDDGKTTSMWTYNGTVPGPLLQARVGDDVTVVFTNDLDEPTTIHWHGMRVPNEMDGIVEGDLVAIEPGATFTYHFQAPDAGTYWFHPHIRTNVQVERGLQGVFVVHEREADAPDVSADRVFVVDDIALTANGSVAPPATTGPDVMHGRYGDTLLLNGSTKVPQFTFAPGQVERWRVVNTANARTMVLRFPGLAVRRIGADAGLWPQALCADVSEVVVPVGGRAELEVRLAEGQTSGTLQQIVLVLDANDNVVEQPIDAASFVADTTLAPRTEQGHLADPTYIFLPDSAPTHTLTISGQNVGGRIEFTLNGHSWPDHEEWSVPQGSLQIIEVRNELGMAHPFHLHGQFFQVVERSGAGLREDDLGWHDTILLDGQGRIRIATLFDNPGMWMMHCHILEHEEHGMMSMVMVEPSTTTTSASSHGM